MEAEIIEALKSIAVAISTTGVFIFGALAFIVGQLHVLNKQIGDLDGEIIAEYANEELMDEYQVLMEDYKQDEQLIRDMQKALLSVEWDMDMGLLARVNKRLGE